MRLPGSRRAARRPIQPGATVSSLADIRAQAFPASFPSFVLRGAGSAACFFAAAFLGRNAEIHIADGGVPHAVLVDLDADRLARMAELYPAGWETRAGDAYEIAAQMIESGEQFDLVTVDPFTNHIPVALSHVREWIALSRRHVLLGADREWFRRRDARPGRAAVRQWLRESGCADLVEPVRVHRRSDYQGGVFWIVLRRGTRRGLSVRLVELARRFLRRLDSAAASS